MVFVYVRLVKDLQHRDVSLPKTALQYWNTFLSFLFSDWVEEFKSCLKQACLGALF